MSSVSELSPAATRALHQRLRAAEAKKARQARVESFGFHPSAPPGSPACRVGWIKPLYRWGEIDRWKVHCSCGLVLIGDSPGVVRTLIREHTGTRHGGLGRRMQ